MNILRLIYDLWTPAVSIVFGVALAFLATTVLANPGLWRKDPRRAFAQSLRVAIGWGILAFILAMMTTEGTPDGQGGKGGDDGAAEVPSEHAESRSVIVPTNEPIPAQVALQVHFVMDGSSSPSDLRAQRFTARIAYQTEGGQPVTRLISSGTAEDFYAEFKKSIGVINLANPTQRPLLVVHATPFPGKTTIITLSDMLRERYPEHTLTVSEDKR